MGSAPAVLDSADRSPPADTPLAEYRAWRDKYIAPAPLGGWSPAEALVAIAHWTTDPAVPLDQGFPRPEERPDEPPRLFLAPAAAIFGPAPRTPFRGSIPPAEASGSFFRRSTITGLLLRYAAEIFRDCRGSADRIFLIPTQLKLARLVTGCAPEPMTPRLAPGLIDLAEDRLRDTFRFTPHRVTLGAILAGAPVPGPASAALRARSPASQGSGPGPADAGSDAAFSSTEELPPAPARDLYPNTERGRNLIAVQEEIASDVFNHSPTARLDDRLESIENILARISDWIHIHRFGAHPNDG